MVKTEDYEMKGRNFANFFLVNVKKIPLKGGLENFLNMHTKACFQEIKWFVKNSAFLLIPSNAIIIRAIKNNVPT